jgi:fibronectin-binding autotransporter adhesin
MQGFFVHVSSGSYPVTGSLAVNNSARVNNLSPLYHKPSGSETPLLRLSAAFEGKGRPDPVVIYFNDYATRSFSSRLDAVKMINTDAQTPNLYAISDDVTHMSIYALPLKDDSLSVVPLTLITGEGGMVVFDGSDIEHIPPGMQVFLTDVIAGVSQDLQANPQYRIRLNAGTCENRFFLSFRPRNALPGLLSGEVFNAYSSGDVLYIDLFLLSGGKGEVVVTNLAGQKILSQKISGFGLHEIPAPWITGVYIVSFVSNGQINSKKIFISRK